MITRICVSVCVCVPVVLRTRKRRFQNCKLICFILIRRKWFLGVFVRILDALRYVYETVEVKALSQMVSFSVEDILAQS